MALQCKRKEQLCSMGIKFTGFDYTSNLIKLANELRHKVLVAGMPQNNNKLNMIALVQETGKHIEAKNYPYLVIPTSNAAGRKTSEIAGLYQRGHTLGISDPSQANGYRVMFILRKSVDIPPRPFLRITVDHKLSSWNKLFNQEFLKVAIANGSADEVLHAVGKQMVSDIQDTMKKMSQPANAPLTSERKGFNDPLIDTKLMLTSVTYFVINKEV